MTSTHNRLWLRDLLPIPEDQPIKLSQETMLKLLEEQKSFDRRVNALNNYVERQIDIKVDKQMDKLGYGDWDTYNINDYDFDLDEEDEDAKALAKLRKTYWEVQHQMQHKASLVYSEKYLAIFMEELKTIQSLAPKDEDGRLHTIICGYDWYTHLARHCGYTDPRFNNEIILEFQHGVIMNDARIGLHHCLYYRGKSMGQGTSSFVALWRAMPEEEREVFTIESSRPFYSAADLWEMFTEEEKAHPKLLNFFLNNLHVIKAR